MNYHIKDTSLSEKEFKDLKWCVGEYSRICREQSNSEFGTERLTIAESLVQFLDNIEWKNIHAK